MNRCNQVRFEGQLTSDPKCITFNKVDKDGNSRDVKVTNFTIAVNGGRTGSDNEVFFARCESFDTGAERIAEYRKGDRLHIEGIARNKEWKDKQSGELRREVVFRVTHFIEVSLKPDYADDKEEAQTV